MEYYIRKRDEYLMREPRGRCIWTTNPEFAGRFSEEEVETKVAQHQGSSAEPVPEAQ